MSEYQYYEFRAVEAWREIEDLISTSRPNCYDRAVALLQDLRDLEAERGTAAGFRGRVLSLMERYAKRTSLLQRMEEADLV